MLAAICSVASIIQRPSWTPILSGSNLSIVSLFSARWRATVPRQFSSLGQKSGEPRVLWPLVYQNPASIREEEWHTRRRRKKALHHQKLTEHSWHGTALFPMCRIRYGSPQQSGKSLRFAGTATFSFNRGSVLGIARLSRPPKKTPRYGISMAACCSSCSMMRSVRRCG